MKRGIKYLILTFLLLSFVSLISCKNDKVNNNNDVIQLWYYKSDKSMTTTKIEAIVKSAKAYCDENYIPLEIVYYDEDTLSLSDYIFKRNLAASNGNLITLGSLWEIEDLANHHADYSKLENYNNLLDGFKDRFCIPLGMNYVLKYLKSDILQFYNIKVDKSIITYSEYLNIKQEMKNAGARFEFNFQEFRELVDYYLYKNGLSYIYENRKAQDSDKLKVIMKEVSLEIYEDILLNYNIELHGFDVGEYRIDKRNIFDENSELYLLDDNKHSTLHQLSNPDKYNYIKDVEGTIICIDPTINYVSPNFFLYKKISNDKIYDLANYIVNEETFVKFNFKTYWIPTFKIDKTRNILMLNEDLKLDDKYNVGTTYRELTNDIYEIYIKDKDKSKEVADSYYYSTYVSNIKYCIMDIVEGIAKSLSIDGKTLEKYNPTDERINKIIDEKINESILDLHIRMN